MDDSIVNRILHLAKLKMGLSQFDRCDQFSVLVTIGNQQCTLTHEELRTKKLNLQQNLNEIVDCNIIESKEFQNLIQEPPLNLSIKDEHSYNMEPQEFGPASLDLIKVEKYENGDATNNGLSNGSEVSHQIKDELIKAELIKDELITAEYLSSETNDCSYPIKHASEPGPLKEPIEEMEVTPVASVAPEIILASTSSAENETIAADSTEVEAREEEHTSRANSANNQRYHSNPSASNSYSSSSRLRRCYFCQEMTFHSAWNCPKRKDERDKNRFSAWAPRRPQYKPYHRLWPRNNNFNNASMNFGQKDNYAPSRRGTFRRVYERLQHSNQAETTNQAVRSETSNQAMRSETSNQSDRSVRSETTNQYVRNETTNQPVKTKKKSKKASSTESGSDHKILFKGEWYTNRVAADAELYLDKKEEVSRQIKKEHRELDEGFEDIQLVLSDDEYPNENPTFPYNHLQKHFKDDDDNAGGSSASFSAAA